jgi:cytochrome c oxidase assembly protein subunit 11
VTVIAHATLTEASRPRRNWRIAAVLAVVVAGMIGLSYAAVPLYSLFCQVTGFGGTTQRAEANTHGIIDREVTVRFDANVAPGLPWTVTPAQHVTGRIGEIELASYRVTNHSRRTVTGTAGFNVTPEIAGAYFNKIECFCFTEQPLAGGATAELPVVFFIDPAIAEDKDTRDIPEITLSYTFFPAEAEGGSQKKKPVAAATSGADRQPL